MTTVNSNSIAELVGGVFAELASILITNAELIPDPRPNRQGATDCYAVTLDDLEALRDALEAINKLDGKDWSSEKPQVFFDEQLKTVNDGYQLKWGKSGIISDDWDTSNAHTLDLTYHYFGGFENKPKWPVIDMQIGFRAGEEQRAIAFAAKLRQLVSAEFSER
jgi:hypothetical protein